MQTKNVNQSAAEAPPLPPRGLPHQLGESQTSESPCDVKINLDSNNTQTTAEVDGYGAYKPVPPPKPLSSGACHSPPPYRMPPYPLYGETAIPGAAAASDTAASTAGLHTHSSKFPIEREVILSSADKNSKIPILHEYKKQRPKSIAPEGPNKQVAWTEEKKSTVPEFRNPSENQYMYNSQHCGISTGAVPRTWTGSGIGRNPQTYQSVQSDHSVQDPSKDLDKNKAFPSRTYHTIKDMISSRFGNGKMPKDSDGFSANDKLEVSAVPVLNNTPEASAPNRRKDNADEKQNRNFPGEAQGIAFRREAGEGGSGSAFHNTGRRDLGEGVSGGAVYQSSHIPTDSKTFTQHVQGREAAFHNTHIPTNVQQQGPPPRREGEVTYHMHGRRDVVDSFHNQQRHARTLEQAGIYMVMRKNQPPRPQTEGANYGSPNTVGLAKQDEEDDDDGGFIRGAKTLRNSGQGETVPGQQQSSGQSSDYEKATQRSNADSGRGSTVYSSGHQMAQASERLDTSTESSDSPQITGGCREGIYSGLATANDSEWVDIVESELRQILDPKLHGLGHGILPTGTNSTLSESISSMSPPLPPLSPGGGSSPSMSPQHSRYKHSSRHQEYKLIKQEFAYLCSNFYRKASQSAAVNKTHAGSSNRGGWGSKTQASTEKQHRQKSKKSPSVFGLDTTDLTSTTTGLDSMLDGNTENNSSDDDLSTTIDATDAHAIRKQLEGLENMYSEVLKLLGVKKYGGRYQPSDPRINKRRLYGSMSSLPSSVSSRPMRDKRRQDERKKVKDIKGINKRSRDSSHM
ncbi:hypothetical protein L9F63_017137 [Diploptera punctata]|uniref:Uncharacterized protein n=1 Tax=Diploptera punctata TaxID=6984 RepID=A0AAD8EGN1_DIPPU|nr:hypothetical protein L9F63_017137 [Diploptera punctata]